jgi:hypothetical protein
VKVCGCEVGDVYVAVKEVILGDVGMLSGFADIFSGMCGSIVGSERSLAVNWR